MTKAEKLYEKHGDDVNNLVDEIDTMRVVHTDNDWHLGATVWTFDDNSYVEVTDLDEVTIGTCYVA